MEAINGVNVIESCQTDMSHACNAHFSQISAYNSGIKNALGVLRKAGRLGEEAKAVDEEGDVVEMAEGMAREARDNFQDSMKDAMAYIRRGMRVAAQELASGEIDRVSDAKRRWEDLRNIAGFSDEEIEDEWRWSTNNVLLTEGYTNWYPGEPNHTGNCAVLWGPFLFGFGDLWCDFTIHFICEKE